MVLISQNGLIIAYLFHFHTLMPRISRKWSTILEEINFFLRALNLIQKLGWFIDNFLYLKDQFPIIG